METRAEATAQAEQNIGLRNASLAVQNVELLSSNLQLPNTIMQIPELTADELYDIREVVRESFEDVEAESAKWNAEEEARAAKKFTVDEIVANLQPKLDAVNVTIQASIRQREANAFANGLLVGCAIGVIGMVFTAAMMTT